MIELLLYSAGLKLHVKPENVIGVTKEEAPNGQLWGRVLLSNGHEYLVKHTVEEVIEKLK